MNRKHSNNFKCPSISTENCVSRVVIAAWLARCRDKRFPTAAAAAARDDDDEQFRK